ncbi:MAG: large-conductance mechanosensitive channel protein MscL [Opitutae bacterium]|nr:large-conductance mechanosensitive channel protein MscL [Opitutae bacterium]
MSLKEEFKKFALRGNVADLAVGVILGASFGAIVKSLVEDVIMPPLGVLLGNVDFSHLYFVIKQGTKAAAPYATMADAEAAGAVIIKYGSFTNTVISFLIVSFTIFLLIRQINKLKDPVVAAGPSAEVKLLTEIRDSLKK